MKYNLILLLILTACANKKESSEIFKPEVTFSFATSLKADDYNINQLYLHPTIKVKVM